LTPRAIDKGPAAVGKSCPVLSVTDGDAIRVMFRGQDEPVRLLRIDTPEKGEPGHDEATAALNDLIGRRSVRIEFETPGKEERDRFGRLLCYVFLLDGRNVNVEMVRLGWSKFWTRFGRGRLAEQFEAAEREAREAKRGLWAEPLLIDPAEPPTPTPSIDEL